MNDPFMNQPPIYSDLFKAILNGLERAIKEHDHVEADINYVGLRRVIGGCGQGQGKERSDKPIGSEREPARASGYYAVFCTHHVPYYRPCGKCGRDKALAQRNIQIVLKSLHGVAFYTK